jgi:protein gp37
MTRRLQAMGRPAYRLGFTPSFHPELLNRPKEWKTPRLIFVNSMSDLFLPEIPFDFIRRVFGIMNQCPQHAFQVLTKRPDNAAKWASQLVWSSNIWMGTTVENAEVKGRIRILRQIPAAIRFLSLEPLLSGIPRLPLSGINWVIVGGESGPHSRPMKLEWVREIRDRCVDAGVPFFFKQWGGTNKKKTGRLLDERTWNEMPERIQEAGQGAKHE